MSIITEESSQALSMDADWSRFIAYHLQHHYFRYICFICNVSL